MKLGWKHVEVNKQKLVFCVALCCCVYSACVPLAYIQQERNKNKWYVSTSSQIEVDIGLPKSVGMEFWGYSDKEKKKQGRGVISIDEYRRRHFSFSLSYSNFSTIVDYDIDGVPVSVDVTFGDNTYTRMWTIKAMGATEGVIVNDQDFSFLYPLLLSGEHEEMRFFMLSPNSNISWDLNFDLKGGPRARKDFEDLARKMLAEAASTP